MITCVIFVFLINKPFPLKGWRFLRLPHNTVFEAEQNQDAHRIIKTKTGDADNSWSSKNGGNRRNGSPTSGLSPPFHSVLFPLSHFCLVAEKTKETDFYIFFIKRRISLSAESFKYSILSVNHQHF